MTDCSTDSIHGGLPLGMIQKPVVKISHFTEGQMTTLTVTALGFCSGSDPKIPWTWERIGQIIAGNTAFQTRNLTVVPQTHSLALTFNSSAEHHVTGTVSLINNITGKETVTLNVTCEYSTLFSHFFNLQNVTKMLWNSKTHVSELKK